MSSMLVFGIVILLLIAFIVIGVPLPAAFGTCVVTLVLALQLDPSMVIQVGYSSITSYTLLAMPLFIIGGELMANTRIGQNLVEWLETLMGRLKAGLMPVTACAYAIFGAVSGSGMAVMSSLTPVLYPTTIYLWLIPLHPVRNYPSRCLSC